MSEDVTIRQWIIQTIHRILAGEVFGWEDWESQPTEGWEDIKPKRFFLIRSDKNPAYSAWLALQWWVNDEDIRAKDPDYTETRKKELGFLLEQIEANQVDRC